jgi:hypothetical protein
VLPSHRAKYTLAYDADTSVIFENTAALPRAFLAPRAVAIPPDDWSLTQLTDTSLNSRTTVLLERATATAAAPSPVLDGPPLAEGERSDVVRYEPDRVTVQVQANEQRYLVLSDSYFPGWRAWIDGRPVEVERANYLFRAVAVPPGQHLVEWRYQPVNLFVGGGVSAVALALIGLLTVLGIGPRRSA